MEKIIQANKGYWRAILALSIAIPCVVAMLLFTSFDLGLEGEWVKFLPTLNALLNSTTSVLLLVSLWAIFQKRIALHRGLMLTCLLLGALFLVSYVIYHASSTSTIFGDANHDGLLDEAERQVVGGFRMAYLLILLSHIGLSIVVVPLVLISFYFSLSGQLDRHRKIVRFSFPIWFYVSVTGVIVYLMISPYYI